MPESGIIKYHVRIRFEVEGVVEKADLIGAIFGQTEGLFGPEMNLHELQKNWKVGRIEIKLESKNGRTNGQVIIPMGTDMSTAALIAAAIENIDKVGPCTTHFSLTAIEDVRAIKRKAIADRAKIIMKEWASKTSSQSEEILKEVSASTKAAKIITFGKENLPAGPEVYLSNEIYLVEGRADVNNLLRSGISNVIAMEGTKVPQSIINLAKDKKMIAFLDGDRGGDLIQKELLQVIKPKKIYRAPNGKEVEDLTPVQILEILNEKTTKVESEHKPETKSVPKPPKIPQTLQTKIKEIYPKINGTLEAVILDTKMKNILQVPVNQLFESLSSQKNAKTIIFDGIVTQRLVDVCASINAETVICHRAGNIAKKPTDIAILTFKQLELD
jgi:DNA primase|tara:strand:- start:4399 stop:5556 length:1158 start_codon:yes stop_codon:yes gene_type:complete